MFTLLVFFNFFPVFSLRVIIPRHIFHFSSRNNDDSSTDKNSSREDPRFKMILWSIIAGTRGGINRIKILNLIKDTPLNANRIATVLELDHKTVIHHIIILSKNKLITKDDKKYGATYKLTSIMKDNQNALEEIVEKIGTK